MEQNSITQEPHHGANSNIEKNEFLEKIIGKLPADHVITDRFIDAISDPIYRDVIYHMLQPHNRTHIWNYLTSARVNTWISLVALINPSFKFSIKNQY